ncbi:zinc transport system ATP-binding protein [Aliiroseovarius sediminilitoris]|uniref:Zinc transport system ATP-binding protein n=1 Tax=Aliiroseovarius sediminilitoris TaxID=1173584 RepID=A0A1I0Q812_9RHOB|nr:metal ABC transporter ATP-binding protein [Aliiroseovarius sediminilitoris]SEW23124.1 zinc transport system ATP-binding protein [Aliiroseovarius sediminilitoris]
MSLITARNLSVSHGRRLVLSDVNLTIEPGEIVTIVGPNGSGKSTLLRALLGMLRVSGEVTKKPGLVVGYVPQKLALDPSLPMPVTSFLNLPKPHSLAEQAEVLRRVGVRNVADQQVSELSGGQLQRVLLARALLSKPDILVLDEPTQGLDQNGEAAFYQLIEAVRTETGVAVLMVSHDLHVVMSASDRVICLNGHVCCEGTPHVVRDAPEYRALFGQGTRGALALYQHEHDHEHHGCTHDHSTDKDTANAG